MIKILKALKPIEWILAALVVAIVVLQVYFDLSLPEYTGKIFLEIQLAIAGASSISSVWSVGFKMFLVAFGSISCSVVAGFISARIAMSFAHTLRRLMFDKVQGFSLAEINKFSTPSLITRSSNDVVQVANVVIMSLRMAVHAPITAVLALAKLVGKSGQLSVATAIAIVFVVILIGLIYALILPRIKVIQKLTDKINQLIRENLLGLKVVRAFNAERYQEDKFDAVNKKFASETLFINRVAQVLNPAMQFAVNAITLTVVWAGAYLINNGTIPSINILTEFTSYSIQVLFSFMMISMLFVVIPRSSVSATRINEVLNTKNSIVGGDYDDSKINDSERKVGEVEFKNVCFKYPGASEYVLHDISFTAKKGQTVAFIGSTGSGKSTIVNLIPRFYDATEGEILIDGVNISKFKIEALNRKMGYVPQKGFLFDGTIKENMLVGKENATDEEISRAIEIAQGAEFVSSLEDGLDYRITSGGTNVSGGQRQRLSIARAIIKQPEIYIFDDSFSALDYSTDKKLRAALKQHTQNVTTFVVASRIGTIMDADKIIVLESGKMVGEGTHKQLLKSCAVYQEIAYSQLSKEELE